ncbi:MAG: DNA mismatch repair protein MutS [Sedimenticola sp.]|jgi:DNA-nicking Smr family endonuclease|nr:MAG: DNA mismatch repair protein MutS [Sedimenticola sp.]
MSEKKKQLLSDEDASIFRQEVEADRQLHHDKAEPFRRRRRPVPLPPNPQVTGEEVEEGFVDLSIETSDELSFVRPGVQTRLFQELRRGHIRPDDLLDLHGLRVAEARSILAQFLANAKRHRLRVVHIIHGKGYGSQEQQPILKQKINQWLRQRDEVLAFCSAPRFDGGTGAAYVLLSRKKGDDERR